MKGKKRPSNPPLDVPCEDFVKGLDTLGACKSAMETVFFGNYSLSKAWSVWSSVYDMLWLLEKIDDNPDKRRVCKYLVANYNTYEKSEREIRYIKRIARWVRRKGPFPSIHRRYTLDHLHLFSPRVKKFPPHLDEITHANVIHLRKCFSSSYVVKAWKNHFNANTKSFSWWFI